ncbi:MAG: helix-turn-helix domain-containing protein [Chloroflexota bacterium]
MMDADSLPASRQQIRDLADALLRQPRSFVQALMDAVQPEGHADGGLDREFWGATPSARRVRGAAAENLSLAVARRQAVLDESLSRAEVAGALGKSEQAVSGMLDRGVLLGLKVGREWRIPSWQLAPELPTGVLPGLKELTSAYLDGLVSLSSWVQRSNSDLDGAAPRSALLHGEVDDVLAAARSG